MPVSVVQIQVEKHGCSGRGQNCMSVSCSPQGVWRCTVSAFGFSSSPGPHYIITHTQYSWAFDQCVCVRLWFTLRFASPFTHFLCRAICSLSCFKEKHQLCLFFVFSFWDVASDVIWQSTLVQPVRSTFNSLEMCLHVTVQTLRGFCLCAGVK